MSTPFAAYVAGSLNAGHFTFIDVGCSGGIDESWRVFGDRLRVVAFDASAEECERLARLERQPNIHYRAGFVGLPVSHPFRSRVEGKPRYVRNPFLRFSAGRMFQLQKQRLAEATLEEKLLHNAWSMTKLADPERPVVITDVLDELGWCDVDFIKIDIDGPDYEVLHSLDGHMEHIGLLAMRLEVNLFGGTGDWEHTFHNTDRFMRDRGFELMGLDVRTYAMAALPSPFAITAPAQSVSGRPFQAEAFYARDPVGEDWKILAQAMSDVKLAKLAAIFSVWGQFDAAAELVIAFRSRLETLFDVDLSLELLAGEAQSNAVRADGYSKYIEAFEADDPRFYPPPWKPDLASVRSRTRSAWRAFLKPGPAGH